MLRTTLTGFSPALDEAMAGLPASALEGMATALLTSTHTQYGPALATLDAWLEGRPLDDHLLASYVAQFVGAGGSWLAAMSVGRAVRLRSRLAGTECPAGSATAQVLGGQDPGIGWQDLESAIPHIEGEGLSGVRDAAIIAVGSEAGLSVAEIIGVDVEDLVAADDGSGRLTVRGSPGASGEKDRVVVLRESTVGRLRAWLAASKVRTGAMFRHTTDLRIRIRITQRGIRLLVARRAVAAGNMGPFPTACDGAPRRRACGLTPRLLGCGEVFGRGPAVVSGLHLKAHSVPLAKRIEPCPLDGRDVHEDVLRAVLRRDETVALGRVEPLHGSSWWQGGPRPHATAWSMELDGSAEGPRSRGRFKASLRGRPCRSLAGLGRGASTPPLVQRGAQESAPCERMNREGCSGRLATMKPR